MILIDLLFTRDRHLASAVFGATGDDDRLLLASAGSLFDGHSSLEISLDKMNIISANLNRY